MLGPAWIALLRRVPPSHHDALALVMNTGIEIALQAIVRLERDFVVVRGRMTGSMDTGRIMILPFDQVNYLAFNKILSESDINALLGAPGSLTSPVEATPVAVAVPAVPIEDIDLSAFNAQLAAVTAEVRQATTLEPETSAAPETGSPSPPGSGGPPAPISKSILLARLRARLAKNNTRSQR
jgi:hypothetical protein